MTDEIRRGNPPLLSGRRAVITGGSRGIGRAIALEFARQGADIAIVYAGRADAAQGVVAEAEAFGGVARAYQCDVADFAATRAVCGAILADLGGTDIIVNNAGIVRDNLVMRMSEADFDQVVAVNLKGAYNMTHHLMRPLLRSPHGRIISTTSVTALMGNPGQANYAAAKAGLIGFTKSLARELAGRGITCNAIAPGMIETDMTADLPTPVLESFTARRPLKRAGTPEDVAHAAVFLASDWAAYITGQVLQVDGGMRL